MNKVKIIDLHRGQSRIIKSVNEGNTKWHIVATGRQFGKTLLAQSQIVKWCMDNKKIKAIWISPFAQQSEAVYLDIVQQCGKYIKSANQQMKRIVWYNDSVLIFKSAENYEAIRGGWFHYGVIDEAAFMRGDAWPVIRPIFSVHGRKVFVISTPETKNWFYDYYLLGEDPEEPNFKSYKAISTDNPFFPVSDLKEAERTQPRDIVRQEYYAEFIETGGQVFSNIDANCIVEKEDMISKGKKNGMYVFGIDWGAKNDKSVLTIIDVETRRVVWVEESAATTYPDIVAGFVYRIKRFNCIQGFAEVNGVGQAVFDYLRLQIDYVMPFVMNNKSKRQAVSSLRNAMETGKLKLPTKQACPKAYRQLISYQVKATPGGQITYTHPDGGHDDYVDSFVIANYAFEKAFDTADSAVRNKKNIKKDSQIDAISDWESKFGDDDDNFAF